MAKFQEYWIYLISHNILVFSLSFILMTPKRTSCLQSITIATGSDFNKGEATVSSTFAVAFEDAAATHPAVYRNHSWIMLHDNFSGSCNESVPRLIEDLSQLYNRSLASNTQLTVLYAPGNSSVE
ncbi:hypothetical protein RvY_03795 [Ramazzottius varieornatus]|uniref:Uncharacterized protein n=1 Tax=Ramazzottius varieornatus TaxID=947166 RepID=A0A1D1UWF9_RAMVA|nr:hypothetical protein RvY_03795 [Ramazzottius varieornatus]